MSLEPINQPEIRYGLIPTRQSLLSRLKNWNDNQSWKVFFDTYWRLIYNTAKRAGLNDVQAEDVVQETVIKVSKAMPSFCYDPSKGSFKNWLSRMTGFCIKEHFRNKSKENRIFAPGTFPDSDDLSEEFSKPFQADTSGFEQIWNDEWEANLKEAALERIKGKVDLIHYQIFELYVFQDWSVVELAEKFKISRARIYLAKHRVQKVLKREMENVRTNFLKP